MRVGQTLAASAFLLAAFGVSAASAKVYDFSMSFSDGAPMTATGTLDVVGGNAISGTGILYDQYLTSGGPDPITLVTAATATNDYGPGVGGLEYSFGGGNYLSGDTFVPISTAGLLFIVSDPGITNIGFNVWSNGDGTYTGYIGAAGLYDQSSAGSVALTATAVPEPATWAMLLLGFLGIGFMARGARRKDAVAIA